MTIEEVKKVTKCGHCHKVGRWHREECPELQRGGGAEKEQHLLEFEEATFCGLLEIPEEEPDHLRAEEELTGGKPSVGSQCSGANTAPDREAVGGSRQATDFEPAMSLSPYND